MIWIINGVSLFETRENFNEYRACDFDVIEHVREPNIDELKGKDWDYPMF